MVASGLVLATLQCARPTPRFIGRLGGRRDIAIVGRGLGARWQGRL